MNALRLVIVDDEAIARRRLKRLLGLIGGVEVVGEAGDGRGAIACVAETSPDAVLLDIQMPELDGFAVTRRLTSPKPLVVFVTAFDRFAVPAFDVHAVDYLLKPVSEGRLALAVQRVRDRLEPRGRAGPRRWIDRLPVRSEGTVRLVPVAEIDWIEAADNYAVVHTGRTAHVIRETLTRLEVDLDPAVFVRIHRSSIVRIDRIVKLDVATRGDYIVELRDGTALMLSRTNRARLEQALGRRL